MLVIPAIDLMDGQVVRLSEGDFNRKSTYTETSLSFAQEFEDQGATHLHLVDLDGAKSGAVQHWSVIEDLCSKTELKIDFGGGVKTTEEVEKLIAIGVDRVTLGSIAVKNPTLAGVWIERFGAERFILGADVKNDKIAIHGWRETSDLSVFTFIENYMKLGIKRVLSTDVTRDGMLSGPAVEWYALLQKEFPSLEIVASGGVSSQNDLRELASLDLFGTVVGKALLNRQLTISPTTTY